MAVWAWGGANAAKLAGRLERRGLRDQGRQRPPRRQHLLHVLVGAVDQHQCGAFGGIGVAGNHRVEHGAVQRQRLRRPVFLGGGQLEAGPQQRTERLAHLHQHPVVAGAQQALVEAQVVRHVVAAVLDGVFHAGEGGFDFSEIVDRGALGGDAHRRRFHHPAQLLQVAQELVRQPDPRVPVDDRLVEPVPLIGRQHARAHLRPGAEQALGDQRLDGFAHHGAAHAEFIAQQRLGRERAARGVAAGDDGFAQQVEGVSGNVLDRVHGPRA
jgi:hypothetical protein